MGQCTPIVRRDGSSERFPAPVGPEGETDPGHDLPAGRPDVSRTSHLAGVGRAVLAARATALLMQDPRWKAGFGEEADLFGDPCRQMLLELYVQGQQRRATPAREVSQAAGVPRTTALRQLNMLVDRGLAVRTEHPNDRRTMYVALTERAVDAIERFLIDLAD